MFHFAVIPLALLLDFILGDPPNRFHPVAAMGTFIRWMAHRAPQHGPARQFIYGVFLIILGLLLFTLPLLALDIWLKPYPWLNLLVNALLLKSVFSLRRLLEAGREVQHALLRGNLPEGRRLVSWHLVSRETGSLSEGHVASAVAESLSENLADSFVAPLLAFALGGLPLAWAYRFVNTADAMIGYRNERYEYLGKFAARLDDLLDWVPSRLSGILIVLAALLARGSAARAWQVMIAQHAQTASPNAGWPMSAAAGALGVRLEKIGHYVLDGGPGLPDVRSLDRIRWLVFWAATLGGCTAAILSWR
jgi:adenosylcobinamide-phosphate synthase